MFGKKTQELKEVNKELIQKIQDLNSSIKHYLEINRIQENLIKEQRDIIKNKQDTINSQEKTIMFLRESLKGDNKSY